MEKKLTVVIPAYNAHETLSQTLASLLMQTKKDDIHCIIIDDYSEKTYDDIIEKFKKLLSIELIRMNYNQGPAYARNIGLNEVKTPYVMFIDADDNLTHPYVIENLLNPLLEDPKGYMIHSNFIEHKEDNTIANIIEEDFIWTFGKIYNMSYLKKHHIFFGEYNQNEDTAFNMECRLAATEEDFVYYLNDITYSWNYRPNAITKINNSEYGVTTSQIGAIGNIHKVLLKYKNKNCDKIFYNENLIIYLLGSYLTYNQQIYLKNGYDIELLKVTKKYYKDLIDNDDVIFNNEYVDFNLIYNKIMCQHFIIPEHSRYISISFEDFLKKIK